MTPTELPQGEILMETYIGAKMVFAMPMTRLDYNAYRGWALPANENGADDGYLVEYVAGGAPNHPDHLGYISWSPKTQFDNAYRVVDGMTFGLAIELLKQGALVGRTGWNGKGMWLQLCTEWNGNVHAGGQNYKMLPFIAMRTAQGDMVPWLASQTDMLAEDWTIVE